MAEAPPPPTDLPPIPVPQTATRGGWFGAVLSWSAAAVPVVLLAITVMGQHWRAPPALFTAAVVFLPYLYAAGATWLFAVWCVAPDRRLPPVLLAAVLLMGLACWGPSFRRGADPAEGLSIRIETWNVRRLWGLDTLGTPDDIVEATQCVVDGVIADDPDVIALLEVSADDIERLSARLDLTCVHTDYMGVERDDFGGIAICTRENRLTVRSGGPQRFVDDEDWYYLFTELERDGQVFNLLAVHLQPYRFSASRVRRGVADLSHGNPSGLLDLGRMSGRIAEAQVNQSAALLNVTDKLRDPTVIVGDFNSTRDTALHTELRHTLTDAWERSGSGFGGTVSFLDVLPLRVDYIYTTPTFGVSATRVPSWDCSDHRPVVSDLVLRLDDAGVRAQP